MSALKDLQHWYLSQCNGDWEHTYGVSIETLDNPGWSCIIDLSETILENVKFQKYSYGVEEQTHSSGDEWLVCKVKDKKFMGYGGSQKLEEIIEVFLKWEKSINYPE
ncbi:MAG: rhodanese-related sulfurtransferase [Acaryochloris sp. RU_4_1]|nr:rhodanese-related sulfurtransferase [Acaryochloris sp. SU_5_25]NJM67502.1 rhodanese-related sulfurtransferase [Acaryochloris sp. RU_4_1]NJN38891.1 rhodanese-related sulfurtransferase [Acaryochloridaceae cyanobacterium CSU_3_4]NJR56321.1 rhodanese-related sulfurtransferase [Acaryochloris sp. CRU_2_0]